METVNDILNQMGIPTEIIKWVNPVSTDKQTHYWHNGEVCSIHDGDKTHTIQAVGNIDFHLFDKEKNREIIQLKDTNNSGVLKHAISAYFANDDDLIDAFIEDHDKYIITMPDQHLYEVTVKDNTTGQIIERYGIEEYDLDSCLRIVFSIMHDTNKYYKH